MIQTAFEKAETAADEGNREKAEENLKTVFEMNPQHEKGWFLKSRLADSFEEKMACFEKISNSILKTKKQKKPSEPQKPRKSVNFSTKLTKRQTKEIVNRRMNF